MDQRIAISQFRRARRSARLELLLARLRGGSAALLCYEQVQDPVGPTRSHSLGIQDIRLQTVVGSVGRCFDYTLGFMPLKDSDQRRWTRVMGAAIASLVLPPIRVYRVGKAHFVVDGHHRVSVARQRGMTHIEAWVVEISTT